jgi:hypothetical protein
MRLSCVMLLGAAVACLVSPRPAAADTFQTPAEVMANSDGTFSYEVAFIKGPGSAKDGGYAWFGVVNVTGGGFADGFCISTMDPGTTIRFQVSGNLTNPLLPGQVEESVNLCTALGGEATTTIRVFNPLGVGGQPATDAGLWNEPNPFTRRTTFHYALSEGAAVSLTIHDVAGRLVATVVDAVLPAGAQVATWDRGSAARAPSGVLFARLSVAGRVQFRRLILLQ